jgi:hypothetical protein
LSTATLLARTTFEFMIYLWGVPDVEDPALRAQALADAGFLVVDWDADHVDALAEYGLRAMVKDPTPDVVRRLDENATLWGYHMVDEPYPEATFPAIAEEIHELRAIDPNPYYFVNMLSTTGEFLRTYMEVVQPELLSFDYYQWWWGSDRYFEKLEQFREQALLADVPLASCIEVTANPGIERGDRAYLPDNAAKLRQSVFTNLAYGVKAIEWFSASLLFEPGTTRLTPWGEDVAAINHELQRIGPELARLRSLDVYHTPPLPLGTREAPREHWVRLIGEENRAGLVYGMFEDEDGVDYVLVANRDYRESQSVTMRLQSKWLGIAPWHEKKVYHYGIEKLDKTTGSWETVSSTSFVGFTFVIAAADGELFRITTTVE